MIVMTIQEFEALGNKVSDGSATVEEKLAFLRELNTSIERVTQVLTEEEHSPA